MKIRLIWRMGVTDFEGKCCEYVYKTDVVELPPDAKAFDFAGSTPRWLPELIGGEWIAEGDDAGEAQEVSK